MSSVHDYTFYQTSRIGDDICDTSQRNIQNSNSCSYLLDNFFPSCPMGDAMTFATSQPAIIPNGSHQVGVNGCNIDENSQLSITNLSKSKCRISLLQRPFATVPFLGRGRSDAHLETQIMQGDLANNRKSINPSSEISYLDYNQTPLIPSLQSTVTNPANMIEGIAAEGWIRGGLPSREYTRDKDYSQSHTSKQYI